MGTRGQWTVMGTMELGVQWILGDKGIWLSVIACIIVVSLKREGTSCTSALDIFCNGDTLSYTCSALLPAHSLTWQITYPGQDPVNINSRSEATTGYFNLLINSTFFRYSIAINSVISIAVLNGSDINGTEVKCSTNGLEPVAVQIHQKSVIDLCMSHIICMH